MFNIRFYKPEDFEMLDEWWKASGEVGPHSKMLSHLDTFIIEENNNPIASVTLYVECDYFGHVENLISNPNMEQNYKREAINALNTFIEQFAKDLGLQRLVCFSVNNKLSNRYQELGFKKIADNISSFSKEL